MSIVETLEIVSARSWHTHGLSDKSKFCEFELFSFDDDDDLRQQDHLSPTDTMVSRDAAAVCDGIGPRLLCCLWSTFDALRHPSPSRWSA